MGHGSYSHVSRSLRAVSSGYHTKSTNEVFKQRRVHADMDPKGVLIRESRDSVDHPESVPVIIALDVTGSMGMIPHDFIKDGLPTLVSRLIQAGIADPAIMFLAIGDHTCDSAPLQVSQFESSDELLDKWLESVYIERGGGGNNGESYTLAHYFAANHTVHDHMEKRGKKGYLFTIGDEPTLDEINPRDLSELMGGGEFSSTKAKNLIDKAKELYHVFHLHLKQGSNGTRQEVIDGWKDLLGQDCIIVNDFREIPNVISDTIMLTHSNTTNKPISGNVVNKVDDSVMDDEDNYSPIL